MMTTAVTDPRERMANQLFMRGYASMKEILTASFGEWPPKGLDIDPRIKHDTMVAFKHLPEHMKQFGGMIYWGDMTIYANERILNGGVMMTAHGQYLLPDVIAHESAHILQSDNKVRSKNISSKYMGMLMAHDRLHPLKGQLRSSFNEAAKKKAIDDFSYLQRGVEMQARLHELMVDGYQRWGRLPVNRDEFWMALSCFGFDPPASIGRYLESLPKESSVYTFKMDQTLETRAAVGMQSVYDVLSAPAKNMFWRETMPAMYSDLIELYGDRDGCLRFFEHGKNKAILKETEVLQNPKQGSTPSPS